MSQWDFSSIQMPQMGNWGRSQSATDALGHLFDLYQGFSNKQDAQKQLANPTAAPTTMGGVDALKGLAGLSEQGARTGELNANAGRLNQEMADTTADRGMFQGQFPGQTPATVSAGQEVARTGIEQQGQQNAMTNADAQRQIEQQRLDEERNHNIATEQDASTRAASEAKYQGALGDSFQNKYKNDPVDRAKQISSLMESPLNYDAKTGWTPIGSHLAGMIDPDNAGVYQPPKPDTRLIDAFNSTGGNAGRPGPMQPIPSGVNPNVTGGVTNAAKAGINNWELNARTRDAAGRSGMDAFFAHPMDALSGTPDRSVNNMTPEAQTQLFQHLQAMHPGGQLDPNDPAVQNVLQQLKGKFGGTQ